MRILFRASDFGQIVFFRQNIISAVKIETGLTCEIGSGDGVQFMFFVSSCDPEVRSLGRGGV